MILASQVGYMASIRDDRRSARRRAPDRHRPVRAAGVGQGRPHDARPRTRTTGRPGSPTSTSSTSRSTSTPSSRSTDLANGTFDAFTTSTPSSVAALRATPDINLLENTKGEERFATLNTAAAPFDQLSARQALAYATDIDRFVAENGSGAYEAVNGMFAPGQLGYTADTGYPAFDLDKAKAAGRRSTPPRPASPWPSPS